MKYLTQIILLLCIYTLSLKAFSQLDHAPITGLHDQTAKEYFEKKLKKDNAYDLTQIKTFLEFLKEQREIVRRDIYETQILETLVLDVRKFAKAKKKGEKYSAQHASRIIRGFDEYLIPTITELYDKVLSGASQEECDGLVDKFTRGFIPYYIPNAYRSRWPMDVDGIYAVQRLILP